MLINCVTIYIKLSRFTFQIIVAKNIYTCHYIKQEVGVGDDNNKDGSSQIVKIQIIWSNWISSK